MDSSFQRVVSHFMPVAKLTHRSIVMRLYRKSLRTLNSWAENRDLFNERATELRAEFDAYKGLAADSAKVTRLLREGKERLGNILLSFLSSFLFYLSFFFLFFSFHVI